MTWEIPWTHEFRYADQGWTHEKCMADERAHHRDDAPAAEGWRVWYFRHERPTEGDGPGTLPPGPIVDFHTHVWTDSFAPRVREHFVANFGCTPFDPGTIGGLRERKRALGVTKSVVLPVPTNSRQVPQFNDWLVDYLDDPDLIPFMGVYPFMDDLVAEVHRCARAGFKGMKLHPINQGFRVSDPRMFPIYEAAMEEGMVILFHAGVSIDYGAVGPTWDCRASEFDRFFERYPYERTVVAHIGGQSGFFEGAPQPNCGWPGYVDLAFQLGRNVNADILRVVRAFGVDRVLFGTDSPWEWTADYLTRMAHIGFTPDEQRAILYDNAARLLGLPPRAEA